MASIGYRNKNLRRKKKTGHARRQRLNSHKKRLAALGVPEDKILRMTETEIRTLLQRPKKTAAVYAK
jgi:hypothetical protein